MRVTKLIREYVEKKVKEAYPKSEAELIWEEKSRRTNEALTRANDIVEAYAKRVEYVKSYGELVGRIDLCACRKGKLMISVVINVVGSAIKVI